jgi:oligopeptide/dipeptide ABC transporter ATP-binding protein
MSVLTVSHLYKRFNLEAGFFARFGRFVNAVNDMSFSIGANESYGLVGESGCGKTTTARLLVRMYEADSGEILFGGSRPVAAMNKEELREYREKARYVFQDPARSLNPRMSVYEVLVSGCRRPLKRRGLRERGIRAKAAAILEEAGLQAADLEKRPSEFSGGQRQRVSIARALLMEPELLICDEVVSALDVSVQGQILNLLLDIRAKRGMSFLFIAHDLKVACYFCDRIGVMYRGEMMEEAPAAGLWRDGLHPYTRLLFASGAGRGTESGKREAESGEKRSGSGEQAAQAAGTFACAFACAFAQRCPQAEERCFREHPALREAGPGHFIRCFKE